MVVDLPRRWRWVIAVECVLILLLAGLFVVASRSAGRGAEAGVPGGGTVAALPPEVGPPPAPTPEADTATATLPGTDQREVCGVGWVSMDDEAAARAEIDARLGPARDRLLARLAADDRDWVRLGALRLRPDADAAGVALELARAASASSDPAVYAMALQACQDAPDPACQMLRPERWAQLDPDNARPWLALFEAAGRRGDGAARQEALFRIAAARRSGAGLASLAGPILDAADARPTSQAAALLLAVQALDQDAAVPRAAYVGLEQACQGDALKDANRLQTCGAVAELFANRGESMLEHGVGVAIGSRVGWTAERVALETGQADAFLDSVRPEPGFDDNLDCAAVAQRIDGLRQWASTDEQTRYRRWVAQFGSGAADFMRTPPLVAARTRVPSEPR